MHRIVSWVAIAAVSIVVAPGQIVPGRFIVELNGEPAISIAARKMVRGARVDRNILAESRVSVQAQHDRMSARIENGRATVRHRIQNVANALVVEMDAQRAAEVAQMAGVKRVHAIRMYHASLDRAVGLQKVSDAWSQIGGQDKAGLGIKIGMIDTGIDSGHPGFQDPNLTMPAGFPIVNQSTDMLFTSNKIIVARSYDDSSFPGSANDICGHGTATSMVAAGVTNVTPLATITGIAPKAYLGNYKVFPDADNCSGAPGDLILQAIDDAVADGMDILNMSLGGTPAERPEVDILTEAVETATAAGLIVVIAAGNDGPGPNTIGSPGSAADAITLGNSHNDRDFAAPLTVAGVTSPYASYVGNGPQPKAGVQGPLVDVASVDPTALVCNSLPAGSLQGHMALILRGTCTFETKLDNAQAAGATAAVVYTYASDPDGFPMAVGAAQLPAVMVGNSDGLDIQKRLQSGSLNVTMSFSQAAFFVNPNRLDVQSSRGPNVDNNIKPDLLAVGDSVLTAAPSSLGSYEVASGTSLASPMVAGAAAILKAARPGLTAPQYRSLLINSTAIFSLDGVTPIGVQKGGSGFLNVASALNSSIAVYPTQLGLGVGGNTVNLTRTLTVTNLGQNSDSFTITVNSFDGMVVPAISTTTVQLDAGKSQDVTVQIQASNLDPGEYQGLIAVHASSSSIEAHIPYWVGVTVNTPDNIVVYSPVTSARHLTRQLLNFRALDSIGVPVGAVPVVTVVSGGGSVVTTTSLDDDVPGLWESSVRLGPNAGDNVFLIKFGGTTQQVTITGQ